MPSTGGKPVTKLIERFDCDKLCGRRDGWDDHARSLHGCTRVDLEPVAWDVDVKRIAAQGWMGAPHLPLHITAIRGRAINPREPWESPEQGCPGGWYRSRFVASVNPYVRARCEGGARVEHLLLARTDDEFLLQCVLVVEHEQDRWETTRPG